MGDNKQDLERLLDFVGKLSQDPANAWFKQALADKVVDVDKEKDQALKQLHEMQKDVRQTNAYIRTIDLRHRQEAKQYYANVNDRSLRKSLVEDYKQMLIADQLGDIKEFGRRAVLQVEGLLNYLLTVTRPFEKIKKNPERYRVAKPNFSFDLTKDFFKEDGSNKNLGDMALGRKLNYASVEIEDFNYDFVRWRDLKFVRDKGSHRGDLFQADAEQLKEIEKNVAINKARYFLCLDYIVKKLVNHIFNELTGVAMQRTPAKEGNKIDSNSIAATGKKMEPASVPVKNATSESHFVVGPVQKKSAEYVAKAIKDLQKTGKFIDPDNGTSFTATRFAETVYGIANMQLGEFWPKIQKDLAEYSKAVLEEDITFRHWLRSKESVNVNA